VRRVRRPPPIPASSRSSCAGCARASTSSGGVFDESSLRARLEELQIESAHPGLWDQRERAQRVLREKSRVEREVAFFERLSTQLEEVELLLELAAEADDAATRAEAAEKLDAAARDLEEAELRRLLGGEHDASNAIVSINSGAGGTDACDWAEILSRMYKRWADAHGFAVEELDTQEGEEAGIRSVTFTVSGDYAFGYLKTEEGVHRLVRISPFDSQSRRHTAFASVSVVPELASTPIARAARAGST
jgi:peptide chain release factor 2